MISWILDQNFSCRFRKVAITTKLLPNFHQIVTKITTKSPKDYHQISTTLSPDCDQDQYQIPNNIASKLPQFVTKLSSNCHHIATKITIKSPPRFLSNCHSLSPNYHRLSLVCHQIITKLSLDCYQIATGIRSISVQLSLILWWFQIVILVLSGKRHLLFQDLTVVGMQTCRYRRIKDEYRFQIIKSKKKINADLK